MAETTGRYWLLEYLNMNSLAISSWKLRLSVSQEKREVRGLQILLRQCRSRKCSIGRDNGKRRTGKWRIQKHERKKRQDRAKTRKDRTAFRPVLSFFQPRRSLRHSPVLHVRRPQLVELLVGCRSDVIRTRTRLGRWRLSSEGSGQRRTEWTV